MSEPGAELLRALACPRDHSGLILSGEPQAELRCERGHRFPIVDGIPVMLLPEQVQTHHIAGRSIRDAYFPTQRDSPSIQAIRGVVDQFVQDSIVLVGGNLYRPVQGRLERYPRADLRLPPGEGRYFLDIGCSWGRWSMAAADLGYRVIGIDPNLSAIQAAQCIVAAEGIAADFVVGDARFLPFRSGYFDVAFSYSVFQHFVLADVRLALGEIRRVLGSQGFSRVQMANARGLRNRFTQRAKQSVTAEAFDVRYWTVDQLLALFSELIGPTELSVDGYFGLGVQPRDKELLPFRNRAVVNASTILKRLSEHFPTLRKLADSVYLRSAVAAES